MRLLLEVLTTHHNDELILLCCTSVMRLQLEVIITMMSSYYCSGCSQDLLDDIQIAPSTMINSWPFILSCSNLWKGREGVFALSSMLI